MSNATPAASLGGNPDQTAASATDNDAAAGHDLLHSHIRARDEVTTKKLEWLDHMLRSLDIITYCHFSFVYFLEYVQQLEAPD